MSSKRSAGRSLPLVLSLLVHGCGLAVLACFATLAAGPAREPQPVTVRLVPHTSGPAEETEPLRSSDRQARPAELAFAPIPLEQQGEEELPLETVSFASELPAHARRSEIGVGSSAALRVPHSRAGQATNGAALPASTACIVAPAEELTPPAPLACPPPEYPAGAASVGERGRVRLEIQIGSDGRVESVRVLLSSGFARLDEAAELGVRCWRFHPARRAGVAIAWRLEHTIVFRAEARRG